MRREVDVQKRIERLENAMNEDSIARLERKLIRIGMLVIALLTLLLIIVTKLMDLIHAITKI
jgi:hypothetical protein